MGNGSSGGVQGCISNATPWTVVYVVTESILQLQGQTYKHDFSADAELKGKLGKEVDIKNEKSSLSANEKIEGAANVGYKTHNQGKIKRIQTKGKNKVPSHDSSRAGLHLIPSGDDKPYYISLWVQHPKEGDILLMDNVRISSQADIRRCVWTDLYDHLNISQICKEPKTWRFVKGSNRNYPPNYQCQSCSGTRCLADCKDYLEYGGYTWTDAE